MNGLVHEQYYFHESVLGKIPALSLSWLALCRLSGRNSLSPSHHRLVTWPGCCWQGSNFTSCCALLWSPDTVHFANERPLVSTALCLSNLSMGSGISHLQAQTDLLPCRQWQRFHCEELTRATWKIYNAANLFATHIKAQICCFLFTCRSKCWAVVGVGNLRLCILQAKIQYRVSIWDWHIKNRDLQATHPDSLSRPESSFTDPPCLGKPAALSGADTSKAMLVLQTIWNSLIIWRFQICLATSTSSQIDPLLPLALTTTLMISNTKSYCLLS